MLVLDRFDLVETADGRVERLGFEDIAALAGLRVRDVLADRKYQGSYQRVAELLKQLLLPRESLHRFFEQVAFTVMVRNGDGHLKNFGVLYRALPRARRRLACADVRRGHHRRVPLHPLRRRS